MRNLDKIIENYNYYFPILNIRIRNSMKIRDSIDMVKKESQII